MGACFLNRTEKLKELGSGLCFIYRVFFLLVLCYNLPRAVAGSTVFRSMQENATGYPQNETSESALVLRSAPGLFLVCLLSLVVPGRMEWSVVLRKERSLMPELLAKRT